MRATGIVRRIDDLGRIAIPKEIRRNLGIQEGSPLELFTEGDKIIVQKYQNEEAVLNTVKSLRDLVKVYPDEFKQDDLPGILNRIDALEVYLKKARKL